jgi:hypothetical protein
MNRFMIWRGIPISRIRVHTPTQLIKITDINIISGDITMLRGSSGIHGTISVFWFSLDLGLKG